MGAIVAVILSALAFAHSEEEFAQAEGLIKSKASCAALSEEQLELIGEYYMEQMHPGELHELMDERMGGEGSAQLTQAHIAMAKSFYCGEAGMMSSGMMNMMMGRTGGGMMGSGGMMGNEGRGMMGSRGYGYGSLLTALYIILLVGIIVLIYLWIVKVWRTMQKSRKPKP